MAERGIDLGKRGFLKGLLPSDPAVIRPPWSVEETIASACTGCGACISACPQAIIRLDARQRPEIDFSSSECTFCGACAEVCSEPVFDRARPGFQHIALIGDMCFAARGVVCQSCGDACPEAAIRFRPRRGGPALPELAVDQCTGCGACIAACPAAAIGTRPTAAEAAHA
ncbi:ferredoxin-type protein [Bosea sp. LC85]|uniref:ferredoxin-type protein NapF n=1 Tax=Bosea sp. LC85 TaxID=1502851 RepID=UPI0004E45A9C|nr:ferredoxin-type protein NapF [Bosea sp. LC85]KFC63285.1 ferredoxin-type protein [Bosea sp. LC85]